MWGPTTGRPKVFGQTNWFTGDIAEILILNRALTTLERQTVESYLKGKYGLTNTPTSFSIPDKVDQPRNSLIESGSISVAGINLLAPISISAGGEYSINGEAYGSTPGVRQEWALGDRRGRLLRKLRAKTGRGVDRRRGVGHLQRNHPGPSDGGFRPISKTSAPNSPASAAGN